MSDEFDPTIPDYDVAREWLTDNGYYRKDVVTADGMRKAAAEIRAEGERLIELADDTLEVMAEAEQRAAWAKANPDRVA